MGETTQPPQETAEQFSDRVGLFFHIEYLEVVEHRGWKSEARPATDEELAMWDLLVATLGGPSG